MHGIHEQATLASSFQADAIYCIVPLSVILVQPVNVACPCLEAMVSITDEITYDHKESVGEDLKPT
jgi:hypothetical protein